VRVRQYVSAILTRDVLVTTVRAARVDDHDDDDDDDRHVISEAREAKHRAPTEMHRLFVSTK